MGFSQVRYNTEKIAQELGISEDTLKNAMKNNAYGGFVRVWAIEDKGRFATGRVSASRKNQDTGEYDTNFQDGYVSFVGSAYNKIKNINIPEKGVTIKIFSCDVTNKYVQEKQKLYVNYTIFDFEIPDWNGGNNNQNAMVNNSSKPDADSVIPDVPEDVEEELPFM